MIQNSGFFTAVELGVKNYFNFKGRASRAEYWFWGLFIVITDQIINLLLSETASWLFLFISIVPNISITIRRLHDVNFSGWWALPIINIVALIVCFLPGDPESNRFGNTPYPIKITVLDKIFIVASIILLLTLIGLNIILSVD